MPADCLVGVKLAAGASAAVEQISFRSQSANGPRTRHRRAVRRARDRRPSDRIRPNLLRCAMSACGPIFLQNDFWSWNDKQLSRIKTELEILIHRTGHSESIIAEFPWPGRVAGTYATISAPPRPTGSELATSDFGGIAAEEFSA